MARRLSLKKQGPAKANFIQRVNDNIFRTFSVPVILTESKLGGFSRPPSRKEAQYAAEFFNGGKPLSKKRNARVLKEFDKVKKKYKYT